MKRKPSLKQRVFLIFGGFTFLLTLLYSGASILVAYVVEDQVLENILAREANYIENVYKRTGRVTQPRVDYIVLYEDPRQAPDEITRALSAHSDAGEVFSRSGRHYHIHTLYMNEEKHPFLVADVTPLLAVRNLSSDILVVFGLALIITMALAIWSSYRITLRTARPLLALSEAVKQQHERDGRIQLNYPPTDREIQFLGTTIENTLNRLNSVLKRESEFNRDLSHELRTPLTILLNTLSLGKTRPLTPDEFEQINDTADAMKRIVSTLLTLARSESFSSDVFSLRALIEECVLSLHAKLEENHFDTVVEVDDIEVAGNRPLAALAINNLILNAVNHASQPVLRIRLEKQTLVFENPSDTPAHTDPTQAKTKHSRSEGFGQGLFLVRRILETLNWMHEVHFGNGCFRFSIAPTLPG